MSKGFLHSSELVAFGVGVLLALVAVAVVAFVLRNRSIGRGHTAYLVAVQKGPHFRLGQAQVSTSSVRWFGMRSMSVRPSQVWRRGDLELGPPRPAPKNSSMVLTDPVRVTCRIDDRTFEIAMNNADYTALRSWSESAPPGIHADVA